MAWSKATLKIKRGLPIGYNYFINVYNGYNHGIFLDGFYRHFSHFLSATIPALSKTLSNRQMNENANKLTPVPINIQSILIKSPSAPEGASRPAY